MLLFGLTGDRRHVAVARMLGIAGGLGLMGVIAVALAWIVSSSARAELALRRGTWPVVAVAGALAITAGVGGGVGRTVALWSGPWGWAVQAGAGASSAQWVAALAALALATVMAVALAWRRRGLGESERFARRAEGRAQLQASLMSFDARTSRLALGSVALRSGASGRGGGLRWLRRRLSVVDARWLGGAVRGSWPWSGATRLSRRRRGNASSRRLCWPAGAPRRARRCGAGCWGDRGRGADLCGRVAAARADADRLDVPSRGSVFLGIRAGRALMAHMVVPALVVSVSVAVCAVGLAAAGALGGGEPAAALALVAVAPAVVCCAGMSARRRGQLPQGVLSAAIVSDPSGGGLVLLGWLLVWPAVAAAAVFVPVRAVALHAHPGAVAAVEAVAAGAVVAAVAMFAQRRDPAEG